MIVDGAAYTLTTVSGGSVFMPVTTGAVPTTVIGTSEIGNAIISAFGNSTASGTGTAADSTTGGKGAVPSGGGTGRLLLIKASTIGTVVLAGWVACALLF